MYTVNHNLAFVLLKQGKDEEGTNLFKTLLPLYKGQARSRKLKGLSPSVQGRRTLRLNFQRICAPEKKLIWDSLQGKVVLLDFWGSWCPPCRESVPALSKLSKSVEPSKVVIISIDEGDSRDKWSQFIDKNQMSWPQVYDEDGELGDSYAVHTFPHYFLLSKTGIILGKNLTDGRTVGRTNCGNPS